MAEEEAGSGSSLGKPRMRLAVDYRPTGSLRPMMELGVQVWPRTKCAADYRLHGVMRPTMDCSRYGLD